MITKIIFYISLALVALMLVQTIFQRIYQPGGMPKQETAGATQQDKIREFLQQGVAAKKSGNPAQAEEKFREGFKLARQEGDKSMVQAFVVLIANTYMEQKNFDQAQAFLEVTHDKGDIDTITYHSQRVALFDNQGKTGDMCTELKTLETLLSGLACETVDKDIKVFLEGKDKAAIVRMMQGQDAARVTDCIGKYAVRDKLKVCK